METQPTPTSVGMVSPLAPASGANPVPIVTPSNFSMTLTPEETAAVQGEIERFALSVMPLREIALLGHEPEEALHEILDEFLSQIDEFDNPQIFALVRKLNDAPERKDLLKLSDQVLNSKPGWLDKLRMALMSKKARRAFLDKVWEKTWDSVRGNTSSLAALLNSMQAEMRSAQAKLDGEIGTLERLKVAYQDRFRDFAVVTVLGYSILDKAKAELAAFEQKMDKNDPDQASELQEMRDKVQALESRTLALEGTMTRLPADQLTIRQLENAAIQTLQETTTTMNAKFASIKSTLLIINGSMVTRNVQRLDAESASLDADLNQIRGAHLKQTVTIAANAPGDNRLKQAEQLKQIVADTGELYTIVEAARTSNAQKFGQARTLLQQSRKELLAQATKVQPGRALRR